jgi:hypothetical protein
MPRCFTSVVGSRETVVPSEITEALREARQWKAPWHRIGQVLKTHLAGENDRDRVAAVWEVAAEATGLKPVILKRLVVIAERLEGVSRESEIAVADLLSGSYGAVELALRLYDRDPKAGLRALFDLRAGSTTIAVLQRQVSGAPPGSADPAAAARSAALVRRAATIRTCRTAIAGYIRGEFGRRAQLVKRPVMRHFHRLGFEAAADRRILAGVDLHLLEPPAQFKDSDGLARSLLLARHLPVFALALAKGHGLPSETARQWAEAADVLGMGWVGVLAINADGAVELLREAAFNPHDPDPAHYFAARAALAVGRGSETGPGEE